MAGIIDATAFYENRDAEFWKLSLRALRGGEGRKQWLDPLENSLPEWLLALTLL
jgi:hypothetical protein